MSLSPLYSERVGQDTPERALAVCGLGVHVYTVFSEKAFCKPYLVSQRFHTYTHTLTTLPSGISVSVCVCVCIWIMGKGDTRQLVWLTLVWVHLELAEKRVRAGEGAQWCLKISPDNGRRARILSGLLRASVAFDPGDKSAVMSQTQKLTNEV